MSDTPEIEIATVPTAADEENVAVDAAPDACHRSWLVGFQQARPQMQIGRGGKIVDPSGGQPVMVPVPSMMPCLKAACVKWSTKYGNCIERVIDDFKLAQLEQQVPPAAHPKVKELGSAS
jgi:hypothetical protein